MQHAEITQQLQLENGNIDGQIDAWKKHVSSDAILADRTTRRTLVLFSAIVALACWFDQIPVKISQSILEWVAVEFWPSR